MAEAEIVKSLGGLELSVLGPEDDQFLRAKEVAKIIGISISTMYNALLPLEDFPKAIPLSERRVVWSKKEVMAWVEYKKRQPRHVTLHAVRGKATGSGD